MWKETNRAIYEREINTNDYYRISVEDFKIWLLDNNLEDRFYKSLHDEDNYDIAVDFSIPISLVKFFKYKTA